MKGTGLVLGLLLLASQAWASERLIVAAADPWPPFVDPGHPSGGLSMEIIREAFKTQGYEVKLTIVPWARAEAGVSDGVYDILPDVWHTQARSETLLFSKPYATNVIRFIKLKGDPFEFSGIENLRGKRIGAVRGYGYSDAFNASRVFERQDVVDVLTNVRKLLAGRIDLTLDDEIVARSVIGKNDRRWLEQIEFTKGSLSSNPLHIAAGLKNPRHKEIIDAFDKGFEIIKDNGTFDRILGRHGLDR